MFKKTIKFTDYNGTQREEDFYFNINKAEAMEMEYGTEGGLAEKLRLIVQTDDKVELMNQFKDFILKSVGRKSPDGKKFIKKGVAEEFEQTEAYVELYVQLATDADFAGDFMNGVLASVDMSNVKQPVPPKVVE